MYGFITFAVIDIDVFRKKIYYNYGKYIYAIYGQGGYYV